MERKRDGLAILVVRNKKLEEQFFKPFNYASKKHLENLAKLSRGLGFLEEELRPMIIPLTEEQITSIQEMIQEEIEPADISTALEIDAGLVQQFIDH